MPATSLYPVVCVLRYMNGGPIAEELIRAASWRFTGQSEAELCHVGYVLFGVNAYMAEVARAQIWSMEAFLSPDSDFNRDSGDDSRALHRSIGTTMEFWGWRYLHMLGGDVRHVTHGALSGETRVEQKPGSSLVPTFHQFIEAAESPRTAEPNEKPEL